MSMSALWILGLGASIGYLMTKRTNIESRLETAVKEYDGASKPSKPSPPVGADMNEIRAAWRYTGDVNNDQFNESLPAAERQKYLNAQAEHLQEVSDWDNRGAIPTIVGVYLE